MPILSTKGILSKMNKRAQIMPQQWSVFNLFTIMVVVFLAVVIFGGLIYISGLMNDVFHKIGVQNEGSIPGVNFTKAADDTFGKMNDSVQALRLVALSLIFSLFLGTIMVNALMRINPAFFFVYVLIVFFAVLLAAPISNAYYTIAKSDIYNGILQSFTGSNWVLLNLPFVITIVGLLGGIFLFSSIIRGQNEGVLS